MTIQDVLTKFSKGTMTISRLIVEIFDLIDKDNAYEVLPRLPQEAIDQLREFVANYQPGRVVCIGGATDPGIERVTYVKNWLKAHTDR